MSKKRYVVGFMFDNSMKSVLLIQKNRPDWQAGKLNGIGGHIEPGEYPIDAMVREFREETDVKTEVSTWAHVLTLRFPYAELEVFSAKSSLAFAAAKTVTDEPVIRFSLVNQYFHPGEGGRKCPCHDYPCRPAAC